MTIVFLGPLVVMPVYFIKSRGWVRGILATPRAAVYLSLLIAVFLMVNALVPPSTNSL
jgi:hypothetical protein